PRRYDKTAETDRNCAEPYPYDKIGVPRTRQSGIDCPRTQRHTSFSRDLSTRSRYYFLQLWQRGLLLMTPLVVTHSVQRCFRQELHSRVCSWQTTPPHSSQTA